MRIKITAGPLLLFLISCVPASARAAFETYSRTQIVFGNVPLRLEITTTLAKQKAFRVMAKGFAMAREIDAVLSPFREDSELSRLNALAKPVYGVKLSPLLCEALEAALRFTKLTENHFDVTFPMRRPDASAFSLDDKCRADLLRENLLVNPTGLVKGLTVDHILAHLKKNGKIRSALVAASGDIGAFDRNKESTRIDLHNPTSDPKNATHIDLENEVVSTSGFYERGRHVKNTGEGSRRNHLQTTVVANDGVTSDALATALLFMPEAKMKKILARFPGVRAVVYRADGRPWSP